MSIPFRVRERAIATTPRPLAAVNDAHTVECEGAASATFVVDSVNAASGITLTFEAQLTNNGPWVIISGHEQYQPHDPAGSHCGYLDSSYLRVDRAHLRLPQGAGAGICKDRR